jgi:hypothetical protein
VIFRMLLDLWNRHWDFGRHEDAPDDSPLGKRLQSHSLSLAIVTIRLCMYESVSAPKNTANKRCR